MTIKEARIASGLSQVKLSNLLGIPLLTLQFYEEVGTAACCCD